MLVLVQICSQGYGTIANVPDSCDTAHVYPPAPDLFFVL